MSKYVRVRPASHGRCAVTHPDTGVLVVPKPGERYEADHPLVRAYPWLFVADETETPERPNARVEKATRAPGERRTTKRKA